MSKACQYATNDDKIYVGLRNVNVKKAQSELQKTITWTKKSGKGRQEWEWACFESGMRHRKLKTHVKTKFANKVIMFEKTFEFKNAIIHCYGRQKYVVLQQIVLKAQIWAIVKAITSTLNPMVSTFVMNQIRGHWLLSNALIIVITFIMEMEGALL